MVAYREVLIGIMILAGLGFVGACGMLGYELVLWLFEGEKDSSKLRTKPHDIFKG